MKAILHVDQKWGIGRDNALMFRIPADMKFFRETTTGGVVVMGGNTFRSFPNGALKNRTNIVLSNSLVSDGSFTVVKSEDELSEELKKYDSDRTYLIGGASLYRKFFPMCSEILVTKVEANGNADTFVDNLDESDSFVLTSESDPVETNGYTIRFCTYKKIS